MVLTRSRSEKTDQGREVVKRKRQEHAIGNTKKDATPTNTRDETLETDVPLLRAVNALKEAQKALDVVSSVMEDIMPAIEIEEGNAQRNRIQNTLSMEAISSISASSSTIKSFFSELKRKIKGCLINKLPNEILEEIFQHLDRSLIKACLMTCKRWNQVIMGTPTVWRRPFLISGNIKLCSDRLKKVQGLSSGRIEGLTLQTYGSDTFDLPLVSFNRNRWSESKMSKRFPLETLVDFSYSGNITYSSSQIWKCVCRCINLKILSWKAYQISNHVADVELDFCVQGTPLASCRLEKFTVISNHNFQAVRFDGAFLRTMSQVKHLHLKAGLARSVINALLNTAKDSVEELTTMGLPWHDSYNAYVDNTFRNAPTPVQLSELKSYRAETGGFNCRREEAVFPINAPLVIDLHIQHKTLLSWDFMDYCRNNLETLYINTGGVKIEGRLAMEIFDMPRLKTLTLAYGLGSEPNINEKRESYSFASFWKTIRSGKSGQGNLEMHRILPRLQDLTVILDPMMTLKHLVNLVESRSRLGHASIEKMRVCLPVSISCRDVNLKLLKKAVPDFKYNEEWDWDSARLA